MKLRELRRQRGLSAARLGQLVDVSETTVRSWEKGRFRPRKGHLRFLALTLEVSEEEILALLAEGQAGEQTNEGV